MPENKGLLEVFGRRPSVLFVDDEENIRTLLAMALDSKGFKVTAAGTVPEALRLISTRSFDVLIADLNVGYAGDGFTVVSAMRRTQPKAATFILTGYPAFESALEAIRQQVDDFLIKPADVDSVAEKIKSALTRTPKVRPVLRRVADIVQQNRDAIIVRWLEEVKKDQDIAAIAMSDSDRTDHLPRLLDESLSRARGGELTIEDARAALEHGKTRRQQRYTIPLLIREAKILQVVVGNCVQQRLLEVEVTHLVPDMIRINETIQTELEASIRSFLGDQKHSGPASTPDKAKPRRFKAV